MASDRHRRSSTSQSSSASSSPILSAIDSSSALILVHDDDNNNIPFDFSSDDDEAPLGDEPQFPVRKASIPPLAPSVVFLYLLSPYLKLGATSLVNTQLPLKYGLPALGAFAVLSAFVRQIWYMLARYLRKADMEDVILDAFARGRGKEIQRALLRTLVRGGTGGLRVLLAATYLQESVHVVLPLFPEVMVLPPGPVLTLVFALAVLPLSSAKSLASKRVVYATWLSVLTYLAWLVCITVAHTQGVLTSIPSWLRMGAFWQGITATAFAFTSSSTLPLYASLKGTTQPISTAPRSTRSRSFKLLSTFSVALAVLLTLPLVIFSAFPNTPATLSLPNQSAPVDIIKPLVASLNAATLLLGIPSVLITTPALPIPERIRRSTTLALSKSLLFILVILLALVPPPKVTRILRDVLLVIALASTYFLPALIHITIHTFKRPLSIIIPTIPSTPTHPYSTASTPTAGPSTYAPGASPPRQRSPRTAGDELLQRKERALQKRQFRKRIVWDVGVWVLVGGSLGGGAWGVGTALGWW